MPEPYRLFFRDLDLGTIVQEDSDFPNLFGTFTPSDHSGEGSLWQHLQDYMAHSIAGDILMEQDKVDEFDAFEKQAGDRFDDLIETDDWYILENGKREPILIPIFCRDNAIVWRWNVS